MNQLLQAISRENLIAQTHTCDLKLWRVLAAIAGHGLTRVGIATHDCGWYCYDRVLHHYTQSSIAERADLLHRQLSWVKSKSIAQ